MRLHASIVAIIVGVSGLFGAAGEVAAQNQFTAVGASCVPADVDVQADNYETAGHGIRFKGSATGDIRLICGVQDADGLVEDFTMYYKDPDGMSAAYRIRAHLKYASLGSNSATTECTTDSNTNSSTGFTSVTCNITDLTPADQPEWFWFEVVIERTSTAANPEFLGIAMYN